MIRSSSPVRGPWTDNHSPGWPADSATTQLVRAAANMNNTRIQTGDNLAETSIWHVPGKQPANTSQFWFIKHLRIYHVNVIQSIHLHALLHSSNIFSSVSVWVRFVYLVGSRNRFYPGEADDGSLGSLKSHHPSILFFCSISFWWPGHDNFF